MNLDLEKLISSQKNYEKLIGKTLKDLQNQADQQNTLRNVVMFFKQIFTSATQRKRLLCLHFIKDIFQTLTSEYYEKLVDQYLPLKLFSIIQGHMQGKSRSSRTGKAEDKETAQKLFTFTVETITFWAKKLNILPKSAFGKAYEELKKLKIEIPSQFQFYKKEHLVQLWKGNDKSEILNHQLNPILQELNQKFKQCKGSIQATINQAVINDEQVLMRPIIKSVRQFLVLFFSRYKSLEEEQNMDRDVVVVYFHIMNEFYKKICNRLYISIQELISITKQTFQGTYSSEYDSVDRRDMIGLAGVFKYNALTIFQRIHQKIQKQDRLLGPCKISLNLDYEEKMNQSDIKMSKKEKNR